VLATTSALFIGFTDDDAAAMAELRAGSLPVVLVGVRHQPGASAASAASPPIFDVVVDEADPGLVAIADVTALNPIAATSLVVLLRGIERLAVDQGLAAESAVYSVLQSGPEFARWRATAQRQGMPPDTEPAVLIGRVDGELHIELNRPHRHNAFSSSMRDALNEALSLGIVDDGITTITLSGRGPSFCSGGDLGEFGSFTDPATAHRTRLSRSPARLMHQLRDRVHVRLHGACMGGGIELASFASHVTAHPNAVIALPELSLGLIPGAGGTVSVTRRIGRERTAYIALSGAHVTAAQALHWGLVDEINADRPVVESVG